MKIRTWATEALAPGGVLAARLHGPGEPALAQIVDPFVELCARPTVNEKHGQWRGGDQELGLKPGRPYSHAIASEVR